jgi:hypothetical protein
MSRGKIIFISSAVLIGIAATLALREYLLLKRIQETFKQAAPSAGDKQTTAVAPPVAEATRMVYAVKRTESSVNARARFAAFKKAIEARPEILRTWGTLGWKILDDIPALCVRSLGHETPFKPLGVIQGECITHIDGETVNQPMRNLGIWLTLGARSSIRIDTLRHGRKISYHLAKG